MATLVNKIDVPFMFSLCYFARHAARRLRERSPPLGKSEVIPSAAMKST
jgi:hypothetical protein